MAIPSFNVLVVFCIATNIVRLIYEILKHKKLLLPNKISFLVILFNMLLLWSSWFLLCSSDPFIISLPRIINYFGLLLVIIGVVLFLTALFTIKSLETYVGDLITAGIYSVIRHPMYLAFIFWLLGLPIYFEGLYSLILAVLFIINVLFWKHLEEIELIKRFAGYVDYKKHTLF